MKQFQDLTIQDDFMFCKVMQNIDICKKVLQLVLGEELPEIVNVSSQKTIENHSEHKAVRLDVLAEDVNKDKYDVEMQMVNNDKVPSRMRLYQATIDVYTTNKGTPYTDMPNTIIIFFCMFDPIGEGLPIYTFENICRENKEIKLNDGTLKVIVNVRAYEKVKNPELRSLLKYICDGVVTDRFTEEIEMSVVQIKTNSNVMEEYMSFYARMQDEREEGRLEGIEEGMQKGIRKGMARGMQKGMAQGRAEGLYTKAIETAKNCLALNMPIEMISKIAGLSIEEIEKLCKS